MGSYDIGKEEISMWIRLNFPKGSTCLDVGACDGKWHSLLGDWLVMDAVEIYRPNIERNRLHDRYRTVYGMDINNFGYDWYDLIIFGDVIEHMDEYHALHALNYAWKRCRDMVVAVPYGYEQDELYGNPWEKHLQPDLTPKVFEERYPGFRRLYYSWFFQYAYYVKGKSKGGR